MMTRLRNNPPSSLGGSNITRMEDYLRLECSENGQVVPIKNMPQSNVLVYWLENQGRVIARPSGTEPKIKFYFEAIQPVDTVDKISDTKKKNTASTERTMGIRPNDAVIIMF